MSDKPVAQKLQIKPDTTVWLSRPEHADLIEPLPEGVRHAKTLGDATVALIFADDERALREILAKYADHLTEPSILWIAYPKANRADINRDTLWPILGEHAMRPVSQVALDQVWSALRFRPLKEGEPQFAGGH